MAKLITIHEAASLSSHDDETYCRELELGNILFFPKIPFDFPQDHLDFLLAQRQKGAANRKNIAYKPQSDRITNYVQSSPEQGEKLLTIMRNYSGNVTHFLKQLAPPYASQWKLDYASFRPFQEKGRKLRIRARNDLLHVDAFPTRPMHGHRILRFFTNINPVESRYWTTSLSFPELAKQFGGKALAFPKGFHSSLWENFTARTKKTARQIGLPITLRSPYDAFMLNMHNFLKENREFQQNCPKDYWEFPPNSCWMVYTDLVSHAATAGQYALEQTLTIPPSAMVLKKTAPVDILETLTSEQMINPLFVNR